MMIKGEMSHYTDKRIECRYTDIRADDIVRFLGSQPASQSTSDSHLAALLLLRIPFSIMLDPTTILIRQTRTHATAAHLSA